MFLSSLANFNVRSYISFEPTERRPFYSKTGDGETVWTKSSSSSSLNGVPSKSYTPHCGEIHIHLNTNQQESQCWVYCDTMSRWRSFRKGERIRHPIYHDRILSFLRLDGEPRWILEASESSMRSRRKMQLTRAWWRKTIISSLLVLGVLWIACITMFPGSLKEFLDLPF